MKNDILKKLKEYTKGWCNEYTDTWSVEAQCFKGPMTDGEDALYGDRDSFIYVSLNNRHVDFTPDAAREFAHHLILAVDAIEEAEKS